jgi:hypothetical protein
LYDDKKSRKYMRVSDIYSKNYDSLEPSREIEKEYSTLNEFGATFGLRRQSKKFKKSESSDELAQRINALKDCIREIEQKQEHLLERIDSRIGSRTKYAYEKDEECNRSTSPHCKHGHWKKGRTIEEIERKVTQKTKDVRKKYLNLYESHEFSIKQSPIKATSEKVINQENSKKSVEIQVENINEYIQTDPNERQDSLEPEEPHIYTHQKQFRSIETQAENPYQEFESQHQPLRVSKFILTDENDERSGISSQSPMKSLGSPVKSSSIETSLERKDNYKAFERNMDDIDLQIHERKTKIMKSREDREQRQSPLRRSPEIPESIQLSLSKNPFMTSEKQNEKYELVNDSFGSPVPKIMKQSQKSNNRSRKLEKRMYDNDHIIRELEKQEEKLENFIPPSRIEPVPIDLGITQLSLTYQSSPDVISYQYENTTSPPRCKKTRKKLFQSPVHKKEERQDMHPSYS